MDKYEVIYFKNSKIKLVKMTYRNFMMYTSNWIYNRNINEDRVNNIYEHIKNNDSIAWTLEAFEDLTSNSIKIINGQHRGDAIKKFLRDYDEYMDCNREILLWIYEIQDEEKQEDEIIELFKIVNSSIQLNEYELPCKRKIELVKDILINPILKSGIKYDPKTNTAHQPYIHIKEFKLIFDMILTENKELTNKEIINNLIKINNIISCLCNENSMQKLYGNNKILTEKRLKIITQCNNIKFYLNIKDSNYNKDVWINYIKNPELLI
jgi:hypothetical protein